jgi:hypothetical protein
MEIQEGYRFQNDHLVRFFGLAGIKSIILKRILGNKNSFDCDGFSYYVKC